MSSSYLLFNIWHPPPISFSEHHSHGTCIIVCLMLTATTDQKNIAIFCVFDGTFLIFHHYTAWNTSSERTASSTYGRTEGSVQDENSEPAAVHRAAPWSESKNVEEKGKAFIVPAISQFKIRCIWYHMSMKQDYFPDTCLCAIMVVKPASWCGLVYVHNVLALLINPIHTTLLSCTCSAQWYGVVGSNSAWLIKKRILINENAGQWRQTGLKAPIWSYADNCEGIQVVRM